MKKKKMMTAATPDPKRGPITVFSDERLCPATAVRLNARGTIFWASHATLAKKPNSVLGRRFARTAAPRTEEVFVDADPALLGPLLHFLAEGVVPRSGDPFETRRLAEFARSMEVDELASALELKPWSISMRVVSTQSEFAALVAQRCLACCDLRHVPLRGMALPAGCDLSHACLAGMNMSRCSTLRGACLAGADLSGAELRGSDLRGANLLGANLAGANLTNANLSDACLVEATLKEALVKGARFVGADVSDANLAGVKLEDAVGLSRK